MSTTKCLNYSICKQTGTMCYNNYCKNCFIIYSHYIQGQIVYYKPTIIRNSCHMCNTKDMCIVMNLSKSSCQHLLCQLCYNTYILSTIQDEPVFPYSKLIENKYYDNPTLYYHDTNIIQYFNDWNLWNREIQKKKLEYYECPVCLREKKSYYMYYIGFSCIGLAVVLYYHYWLLEYIIWIGLVYISRETLLILYY